MQKQDETHYECWNCGATIERDRYCNCTGQVTESVPMTRYAIMSNDYSVCIGDDGEPICEADTECDAWWYQHHPKDLRLCNTDANELNP